MKRLFVAGAAALAFAALPSAAKADTAVCAVCSDTPNAEFPTGRCDAAYHNSSHGGATSTCVSATPHGHPLGATQCSMPWGAVDFALPLTGANCNTRRTQCTNFPEKCESGFCDTSIGGQGAGPACTGAPAITQGLCAPCTTDSQCDLFARHITTTSDGMGGTLSRPGHCNTTSGICSFGAIPIASNRDTAADDNTSHVGPPPGSTTDPGSNVKDLGGLPCTPTFPAGGGFACTFLQGADDCVTGLTLDFLPITLNAFSVSRVAGGVDVKWTSGFEDHCGAYRVLRCEMKDGKCADGFAAVSLEISGASRTSVTCKGSQDLTDYTYTALDPSAAAGVTYGYQLEEVDTNNVGHNYGSVILAADAVSATWVPSTQTRTTAAGTAPVSDPSASSGGGCAVPAGNGGEPLGGVALLSGLLGAVGLLRRNKKK